MKKRLKSEVSPVPQSLEPDMAGLIVKVQQQLGFLEKKIDILIARAAEKPFERKQHPRPFQRFDQPHRQGEARQGNDFRERTLHKAVCAECNKECEVPFKPTGERPVYCRECFSKRKVSTSFSENTDTRPRSGDRNRERPSHRHESGESRRRKDQDR